MSDNKKTFFITLICSLLILIIVISLNKITNFLVNLLEENPKIVLDNKNIYALNQSFDFVQTTTDFTPLSKQDLKNIIYTTVDSGWNNFTFYCPNEYTKCVEDITNITNDQEILTHLNNFVSPYNSFSNIKTSISDSGEITLNIDYLYTEEKINTINKKIEEIIKDNITDDMDDYEKIKVIHDYLVNNSKYDVERNNEQTSQYDSYTAYGPLIEGYATCNGYTDAMALFLNKLGYKNFKIATTPDDDNLTGHIWNAVYLNDKWLHLDVTWDDPVSEDGKDYLLHKYFLITDEELQKADEGKVVVTEHNYLKNIYSEFK
jgi:transglutaminase/protease-like cytokinesis protein 3